MSIFRGDRLSSLGNAVLKSGVSHKPKRTSEFSDVPLVFPPSVINYANHKEVLEKDWRHYNFRDIKSFRKDPKVCTPLGSELFRFACALKAYSDTGSNQMSTFQLWNDSITYGPEYPKILKRIRTKSLIISLKGETLQAPDWWDEVPYYPIKDIGDIFYYRFLPNYKEPEEDDYEWSFKALNYKVSRANEFRQCLRDILSDIDFVDVAEIPKDEVTCEMGGSSTLEGYRTYPKFLAFDREMIPARNWGVSKPTWVQKTPGESRYAIVNPIETTMRVSWIDKQTREVLRFIPEACDSMGGDEIRKKINKLSNKATAFLMRDIKKEGLTKPRYLLKIMLEELHNFSNFPAFEEVNFFQSYRIVYKNQEVQPPRGHGLGMANALTTLMQVICYRMTRQDLSLSRPDLESQGMFLNDDSVFFFYNDYGREYADDFFEADQEILTDLGILSEPTKSFITTKGCVFCEEYFHRNIKEFGEKQSVKRRNAMLFFTGINISHSKYLFAGLQNEYSDEYLDLICTLGYEFDPSENRQPFLLGGWKSYFIAGVCCDCYFCDEDNKIQNYLSVALVPFKKVIHTSFENKDWYNPYKGKVPDSLITVLKLPKTVEEANRAYSDLRFHPEQAILSWENYRRKRQEAFKVCHDQIPLENWIRLRKSYQGELLPPKSLCTCDDGVQPLVSGYDMTLHFIPRDPIRVGILTNKIHGSEEWVPICNINSYKFDPSISCSRYTKIDVSIVKSSEATIDMVTPEQIPETLNRAFVYPEGVIKAFNVLKKNLKDVNNQWVHPYASVKHKVINQLLKGDENLKEKLRLIHPNDDLLTCLFNGVGLEAFQALKAEISDSKKRRRKQKEKPQPSDDEEDEQDKNYPDEPEEEDTTPLVEKLVEMYNNYAGRMVCSASFFQTHEDVNAATWDYGINIKNVAEVLLNREDFNEFNQRISRVTIPQDHLDEGFAVDIDVDPESWFGDPG